MRYEKNSYATIRKSRSIVPSGETVLSALEKQGYALPNNCRAGACGECRIKVLSGEFDQGFIMDMALSQEDRDEGYGLNVYG